MFALAFPVLVALSLDVPFLPQSESLCGGAAAAMVFRYWGDTHADPQQFAPIIDRRAGGIAAGVLVSEVERRGWQALTFVGSLERLRDEIRRGRPLVALIQVQPGRYHFVVVTGAGEREVTVHDPAWGPSRRMSNAEFIRAWEPASFWSLLILPAAHAPDRSDVHTTETRSHRDGQCSGPPCFCVSCNTGGVRPHAPAGGIAGSACDRRLADAIDEGRRQGLAATERLLGDLGRDCPAHPGPVREMAGVRFAQRRWDDASALAERALVMDAADAYSWEVLASSRYMRDDLTGALLAWNRIGKPRIDTIRISGLERTQYALVADALALRTDAVLTDGAFQRAARRLDALPNRSSSRIGYRPRADGFASVEVAVVERRAVPRGIAEWLGTALRTATEREVAIEAPGATGQGEVWRGAWRWWPGRPRVALSFAAPRIGRLPGVWRVEGSWEAETYAAPAGSAQPVVREERAHGGVSVADWLNANLRYEFSVGLDAWTSSRRDVTAGAALERRLLRDRLALIASATTAAPLRGSGPFRTAALSARFQSSTATAGASWLAQGGLAIVGGTAPLPLWPGAGEGRSRAPLLRAHPLLHRGVIDGHMFGRRVLSASLERQHWLTLRLPAGVAVAAFADAARVWRPLLGSTAGGWQIDVGAGLRLKVPGAAGTLRLDAAHAVRDGARAITVGWMF